MSLPTVFMQNINP